MTDKIFKTGLIFLGAIFLILYYSHSQNGRYQHISGKGIGDDEYAILDTQEGTTYLLENTPEWIALHPRKGRHIYDFATGKEKKPGEVRSTDIVPPGDLPEGFKSGKPVINSER